MHGYNRQLLYDTLKVFDVALAGLCLLAAAILSNWTAQISELESLLSMRISLKNAVLLSGLGIVWHLIFKHMGFYNSHRFSTLLSEMWDIAKGITSISMVILIVQIVYSMGIIEMRTLQLFWLFSMATFIASRMSLRLYLFLARNKGRNLCRILIVGSNERAIEYAHKFNNHHSFGYKVIGFVDSVWHGPSQVNHEWCKLVSNFKDFPEYLRNNIVDEVFVFMPMKSSYDWIASIVDASETQGVTVRMPLDLFNLQIGQGKIEHIEEESMLTIFTGAMRQKTLIVKKLFDRSIALVLLVLLLPLFIGTALAIRFSSPGPVFFCQKRIGRNKRIFRIWKFRTMVPNAELKLKDLEHLNEMGTNSGAFKIKNDPRVTPLGKFLRKFSIDELPQLFNVLKGEMSIVGPRPLTERDYDKFRLHTQARRFSVKPGVTCLWQIGGRNDISFDRWMELDMKYIDEWSLSLDLKILLKTIPAVIYGHGAS